jgi:DNA repair photolyase
VKPRPLANPPNPFSSRLIDYLDGPPPTNVQVLEDHSRSILAHNTSPDVGFDWSINPYRGCQHACSYCMAGDTPILLANGRTKPIAELRTGDSIYGTQRRGMYRRYVATTVLDHWQTTKPAYRVVLDDATELVASGDHRFLSDRGWKHVVGAEHGPARRPHLTLHNRLLGSGRFASAPRDNGDYRRGYLCGLIRGDGLIGHYVYSGRRRGTDVQHHFRLALIDLEALHRARAYLADYDVTTTTFELQRAAGSRRAMHAIRTHAHAHVSRVEELVAWPPSPTADWAKGFLAGIFDAEGCHSQHVLRFSNKDPAILACVSESLRRFGFDCVLEDQRPVANIRLRGGLREHLRFFHAVDPAITRKRTIDGQAVKNKAGGRVVAIEPLGVSIPLYDITTGTGDFIANGVISHNCYARPSHEYLDLGAGTDFDTKIVVKPKAPELLREAFDKPSWKGELVMFSGVTDCYQPLEASLELTRGCLKVCAEYRNPVSIITKAPLVERDIDVLQELSAVTKAHVTVSIPFIDPERARAIEPWVATPQRRLKTVQRLAEAGISVGVNVAPVIPGLNDEELAAVLAAAAEAGANHAGYVLLRLPGSVKQVFEERVRAALPLRAEKILRRIRETRGGALYDPRWGTRQVGEGTYATMIETLFDKTVKRLGLNADCKGGDPAATFRRPARRGPQLRLFDDD